MDPRYFWVAVLAAILIVPITKVALRLMGHGERYLFALSFLLSIGLNVFLILLPGLRDGVFWYAAFFLLLIQAISVVGVAIGMGLTIFVTRLRRKFAAR